VALDEQWIVNNLEVIIEHYKDLEEEIRVVRQEYEGILRKYKQKQIMDQMGGKP